MDTDAYYGHLGVRRPTGAYVFRYPPEATLGSIVDFGSFMSQTLHLQISIARDVYLLYPPNHPWDEELPPAPEFWMHQQDEEPSLYLDPSRFKQYVQTVLERTAFND